MNDAWAFPATVIVALGVVAWSAPVAGQFTDVSEPFMHEPLTNAKGAAWGDLDGDHDLDLIWVIANGPARIARNDNADGFVDVTPAVLTESIAANMPILGDYDNDGDLDLFIGIFSAPSRIYRNDGDLQFTLLPLLSEDPNYVRGGAWLDFDLDGRLDLFASTNAYITAVGEDKLYINKGSDVFVDATPPFMAVADVGRGIVWADFDNDGDLDLFVGNGNGCPCDWEVIPPSWVTRATNRLFRNDGGGSFTDVTDEVIGSTNNARGIAAGDYDNDGDLDVFVTNNPIEGSKKGPKHQGLIGGSNQLLRNEGDLIFSDVTPEFMLEPTVGHRNASWVDVENDGDLDLHIMGRGPSWSHLYINDGAGGFTDVFDAGLITGSNGRAAAWGDYDGDGDLDAFVTFGVTGNTKLVRNDQTTGNHWLEIELIGTHSNRLAVGARATVTTGSRDQIREVVTGSGYWSQAMPTLHFGLGASVVADLVVIRWPDGRLSEFTDVPADQRMVITEPEICPGDLDDSGDIGFADLLRVLAHWGPCGGCPEDLDGDDEVGFPDVLWVLSGWGRCRD